MKISFERTGGFAGMRMAILVDLTELPTEEATSLRRLVRSADFFNLQEPAAPSKAIPDGFQYMISVQVDEKEHTIRVHDGEVPDRLQPLLEDLTMRARTHRGVA